MLRNLSAILISVFATLVVAGAAFAQGSPVARANGIEPVRVVVTIPPLMWPVKQVLGDVKASGVDAEVSLILRPGLSEHGFELTAGQMSEIQRADIVVMAGYGLEPRVESVAARTASGRGASRAIVSFEGIGETLALGDDHAACDHDHGDGHDHDHAHASTAIDPHLWLDPVAMKAFVGRVAEAVRGVIERSSRSDEEKATLVRGVNERAAAAQRVCDEIDAEYTRDIAALKSRAIVTHHNAYSYLCKRYGLTVAAVVRPIETVEPTPGDVMKAVKAIRDQKAGAVFVEPQFPAGVAKRIAETARVRLETIDPLGDGDWAGLMRSNLAAIVRGLGG